MRNGLSVQVQTSEGRTSNKRGRNLNVVSCALPVARPDDRSGVVSGTLRAVLRSRGPVDTHVPGGAARKSLNVKTLRATMLADIKRMTRSRNDRRYGRVLRRR